MSDGVRVRWEAGYGTGDNLIDGQHRDLLARCDALADYLADEDAAADSEFRRLLGELLDAARTHFVAEEAALAGEAEARLEEHRLEREEFEYLAADVATTENFDKVELQRFLALWWMGHVTACVEAFRAGGGPPPAGDALPGG